MKEDMRVEGLTVEELKVLIDHAVERKLEELLGDPDADIQLKEDVKERLCLSLEDMRSDSARLTIEEVVSQTGLRWLWPTKSSFGSRP